MELDNYDNVYLQLIDTIPPRRRILFGTVSSHELF